LSVPAAPANIPDVPKASGGERIKRFRWIITGITTVVALIGVIAKYQNYRDSLPHIKSALRLSEPLKIGEIPFYEGYLLNDGKNQWLGDLGRDRRWLPCKRNRRLVLEHGAVSLPQTNYFH
jgi:hypothetical protein